MTQQVNELIKLCDSCSPSDKWTLFVNRGSRDGIDANGFHTKCDGHSSIVDHLSKQNEASLFLMWLHGRSTVRFV